ncbi:MAG: crossover junction endodeoxyribonuclease RuvC [Firmicutes bacterium]|nr:crossover junction endodeoxyribonuclease RuvC [Bacillota bacterium]
MLILGIDPGTAITGYGLIKANGNRLTPVEYGAIRTRAGDDTATRLSNLHGDLCSLLKETHPDVVAVEQLFFNTNVTTALAVGQARGVILLAAAQAGIDIVEYTPLQVKQTVTGNGRATKQQVAFMVKALLGLKAAPRPDDVSDALAIAICHAHMGSTLGKLAQAVKGR